MAVSRLRDSFVRTFAVLCLGTVLACGETTTRGAPDDLGGGGFGGVAGSADPVIGADRLLTASEGSVFYVNGHGVFEWQLGRVPRFRMRRLPSGCALGGGYLYCADASLNRTTQDGEVQQLLYGIGAVAADAQYVYSIDLTVGQLIRGRHGGGVFEPFSDLTETSLWSNWSPPQDLIWMRQTSRAILLTVCCTTPAQAVVRVDKTSGAAHDLGFGTVIRGLAASEAHVYWSDEGARTIKRAPLAGGATEAFLETGSDYPGPLLLIDDTLYWVRHTITDSRYSGHIVAQSLSTGESRNVVAIDDFVHSMVTAADRLYWVERDLVRWLLLTPELPATEGDQAPHPLATLDRDHPRIGADRVLAVRGESVIYANGSGLFEWDWEQGSVKHFYGAAHYACAAEESSLFCAGGWFAEKVGAAPARQQTFSTGGVATDGRYVYTLNADSGAVVRRPLEGQAFELLSDLVGTSWSPAWERTWLSQQVLMRQNADALFVALRQSPSNPIVVVDKANGAARDLAIPGVVRDLALDDTHAYWADEERSAIMRVPVLGGIPEVFVDAGDGVPTSLVVSDETLYWARQVSGAPLAEGTILAQPINGDPGREVASYSGAVTSMAATEARLYWVELDVLRSQRTK